MAFERRGARRQHRGRCRRRTARLCCHSQRTRSAVDGDFVRSLPLSQIVTEAADRNTYTESSAHAEASTSASTTPTRSRGCSASATDSKSYATMCGGSDERSTTSSCPRSPPCTATPGRAGSRRPKRYRSTSARRPRRTLAGGSLLPQSRATRCRGRTRPGWRTDHEERSQRWLDQRPARSSNETASAGERSRCASGPMASANI